MEEDIRKAVLAFLHLPQGPSSLPPSADIVDIMVENLVSYYNISPQTQRILMLRILVEENIEVGVKVIKQIEKQVSMAKKMGKASPHA